MVRTSMGGMVGKQVSVSLITGRALNGSLEAISEVDLLLKTSDDGTYIIPFSAIVYVHLIHA
jgi:hypothetical protein